MKYRTSTPLNFASYATAVIQHTQCAPRNVREIKSVKSMQTNFLFVIRAWRCLQVNEKVTEMNKTEASCMKPCQGYVHKTPEVFKTRLKT